MEAHHEIVILVGPCTREKAENAAEVIQRCTTWLERFKGLGAVTSVRYGDRVAEIVNLDEPGACMRCGSEDHGGDVDYSGCKDCRDAKEDA